MASAGILDLFARFYQPADAGAPTRPTDLLQDMEYAGMDKAELLAIIERFYNTPNEPFASLEDVERARAEFSRDLQALSKEQQEGKMLIKMHDHVVKVWEQRSAFLSSELLRLLMEAVRKKQQQARAEALAPWVSFIRQLTTPKQKVVRSSGSGSSSSSNGSSILHPGYDDLRLPLLGEWDANC